MNVDLDIPQSEINRMSRQIQLWQRKKRAQMIALIEETTDLIFEDMRANVPVRSGAVKESIRKSLRRGINPQGAVEVKSFVGWFLELGTVNMAAQPFVKPAYMKRIPVFIAKLKIIASTP